MDGGLQVYVEIEDDYFHGDAVFDYIYTIRIFYDYEIIDDEGSQVNTYFTDRTFFLSLFHADNDVWGSAGLEAAYAERLSDFNDLQQSDLARSEYINFMQELQASLDDADQKFNKARADFLIDSVQTIAMIGMGPLGNVAGTGARVAAELASVGIDIAQQINNGDYSSALDVLVNSERTKFDQISRSLSSDYAGKVFFENLKQLSYVYDVVRTLQGIEDLDNAADKRIEAREEFKAVAGQLGEFFSQEEQSQIQSADLSKFFRYYVEGLNNGLHDPSDFLSTGSSAARQAAGVQVLMHEAQFLEGEFVGNLHHLGQAFSASQSGGTLQSSFNGPSYLFGGGSADSIGGSNFFDVVEAGFGADWVWSHGGNDNVNAGDGDDRVFAGGGSDLVSGGSGRDSVNGGEGNDILLGGSGIDSLGGDGGDDQIFGETGDDWLYGGSGSDSIDGGQNDDRIWGGSEADTIGGGDGNDWLYGEDGNDWVYGNAGNDNMNGGNGNDVLFGVDGLNSMGGGAGMDTIHSGYNHDWSWGGAEADLFHFAGWSWHDFIMDFEDGVDRIDLAEEGWGYTSANQISIVDDASGNAFISLGFNTWISVIGVSSTQLTDADFVF